MEFDVWLRWCYEVVEKVMARYGYPRDEEEDFDRLPPAAHGASREKVA